MKLNDYGFVIDIVRADELYSPMFTTRRQIKGRRLLPYSYLADQEPSAAFQYSTYIGYMGQSILVLAPFIERSILRMRFWPGGANVHQINRTQASYDTCHDMILGELAKFADELKEQSLPALHDGANSRLNTFKKYRRLSK